jgi:hypothetical protein
MYVVYNSKNSGGKWWLDDDDWKALEKAGWVVDWRNKGKHGSVEKNGRWLGALATSAKRFGLNLKQAVEEWERVVKCSSRDVGCPCCGNPHNFTEYDDNGGFINSGPDVSSEASFDFD